MCGWIPLPLSRLPSVRRGMSMSRCKSDACANLRGRCAFSAQRGEGERLVALRIALPVRPCEQFVMAVDRRGQAEEFLQQDVHMRRATQILAADDVSHALQGVIVHDSDVITHSNILAAQNYIAVRFWMRCYTTFQFRSRALLDKNQTSELFA